MVVWYWLTKWFSLANQYRYFSGTIIQFACWPTGECSGLWVE